MLERLLCMLRWVLGVSHWAGWLLEPGEAPKLLLEPESPCPSLTKFTWILPVEPGSSLLVFRTLSWYLSNLHTPHPLVQGKL